MAAATCPQCKGVVFDADDTATTSCCDHMYHCACLYEFLNKSSVCALCHQPIQSFIRNRKVIKNTGGIQVAVPTTTFHSVAEATCGPAVTAFRTQETDTTEAIVKVVWKEPLFDDGGNATGETRTRSLEQTIGGSEQDPAAVASFMTALAAVLRAALLQPEASLPQFPVRNHGAYVERALSDESAMAHFFRVLGEPSAGIDYQSPHASSTERNMERSHIVASYTALQILSRQVYREHSHPLHSWMALMLDAHNASHVLRDLLNKLGVTALHAADLSFEAGDEFDAHKVAKLERAYRDMPSLKLLDYDNIGFTKKGKLVGYEQ